MKIRMIPVGELKVDSSYQRGVSDSSVNYMATTWRQELQGTLLVGHRKDNSGYFVIDGQHRLVGHRKYNLRHGKPENSGELPCAIIEDTTPEYEAKLFVDAQNLRNAISVLDKYRALLVQGEPITARVQQVLDNLGLKFGKFNSSFKGGGVIAAIRSVYEVMIAELALDRPGHTERVLTLCGMAWPNSKHAFGQHLIDGMSLMLLAWPKLDDDFVVQKLSRISAESVLQKVNSLRLSGETKVNYACQVLTDLYNASKGRMSTRRLDIREVLPIRSKLGQGIKAKSIINPLKTLTSMKVGASVASLSPEEREVREAELKSKRRANAFKAAAARKAIRAARIAAAENGDEDTTQLEIEGLLPEETENG